LAINVDADPGEYRLAYAQFLPAAADVGYWRLLRDARAEFAPGARLAHWDTIQESEWLAEQLRVVRPDEGPQWWRDAWEQAEREAGVKRLPSELSLTARRVLVETLNHGPDYPSLIVDALARALASQQVGPSSALPMIVSRGV
jgi:hypothetical protein